MTHVARKKQEGTLPPYLGLGVLDPSSTYSMNGTLSAKYKSGTETIYDVSVGAQRSEIVEYFDGEVLRRSVGQALNQAFYYHMMDVPLDDHPRLQELISELSRAGNVYISLATKHKFVAYPAGIIFKLCLPVSAANRATWEAFSGWLEDRGGVAPLRAEMEHLGHILKLTDDGNVLLEEVTIADYSTILVSLKDGVDLITSSGIVLPRKEHRLTVQPIQSSTRGSLVVHPGDGTERCQTFSVLPLSQAELAEHGLVELFREISLRLLSELPSTQEQLD